MPGKGRFGRVRLIHTSVRLMPLHVQILNQLVKRGLYPDAAHAIRDAIERLGEQELGKRLVRRLAKKPEE